MTKAVNQLADGRLWVDSLSTLSIPDAMDLLRDFKIGHIVWRGPVDRSLMNFAQNWGISFQVGDGPWLGRIERKVLVIG